MSDKIIILTDKYLIYIYYKATKYYMQQKLLLRTIIPHSITIGKEGKSTRKLWNNYLLGGWKVYNDAHHVWSQVAEPMIRSAYHRKQWPHTNETKYRISLGFYKGKSTKRCDVSNMSLLLKWCEDLIIKHTPIPDDSWAYIIEARCLYLGVSESGEEEVYLQVACDEVKDDKLA